MFNTQQTIPNFENLEPVQLRRVEFDRFPKIKRLVFAIALQAVRDIEEGDQEAMEWLSSSGRELLESAGLEVDKEIIDKLGNV